MASVPDDTDDAAEQREAALDDLAALMEESASKNHGRGDHLDADYWEADHEQLPQIRRRSLALSPLDGWEDGWHGEDAAHGRTASRTHRGVLHPDEYVDPDEFRRLFEPLLGCTIEDAERALKYRRGRGQLPPDVAATRAVVDAVCREVVDGGGNVEWFRKVFGIGRNQVYAAARRARAAGARAAGADLEVNSPAPNSEEGSPSA